MPWLVVATFLIYFWEKDLTLVELWFFLDFPSESRLLLLGCCTSKSFYLELPAIMFLKLILFALMGVKF